jgi:hypothetical protein
MRAQSLLTLTLLIAGAAVTTPVHADAATAALRTSLPLASIGATALGGEAGASSRESAGGGARMGSDAGTPQAPDAPAIGVRTEAQPRPAEPRVVTPARAGAGDDVEPAPRRARPTGWRGTLPSGVN